MTWNSLEGCADEDLELTQNPFRTLFTQLQNVAGAHAFHTEASGLVRWERRCDPLLAGKHQHWALSEWSILYNTKKSVASCIKSSWPEKPACAKCMKMAQKKKRHEWHDAFLTSSQSQCRKPIIRAKNKRALGAFYPPVISARLC